MRMIEILLTWQCATVLRTMELVPLANFEVLVVIVVVVVPVTVPVLVVVCGLGLGGIGHCSWCLSLV